MGLLLPFFSLKDIYPSLTRALHILKTWWKWGFEASKNIFEWCKLKPFGNLLSIDIVVSVKTPNDLSFDIFFPLRIALPFAPVCEIEIILNLIMFDKSKCQIRIENTLQLSLTTCKKMVCGSKTNELELTFGSSLNASNIKEGDDVYFECAVQASPAPYKITWRHNVRSILI